MNTNITVGELADWIVENRTGNAFKDDTWENICAGVQDDIENHNLLYVQDNDGKLIGVVTFIIDRENKVFFVKNMLVTRYAALRIFAQHFQENFKGLAICANRNNEDIMYNTHRLINHLIGGTY